MHTKTGLRVAVVGAGAAGLCAARHLLSCPELVSRVVVLEQSKKLGGTWVYTETVGYDTFGLPVHTSMYKSLRTNLPKEIMGFPDFPVPASKESYLPAKDMLAFLQLYSDHHNVTEHIKFNHHVQNIKPLADDTWEVRYTDLSSHMESCEQFDVVMVCNGHYNTPFVPQIKGLKGFQGNIMHSHDYRVPDIFKNERVLVIGAGPSGMDIALEITQVTKKVILSHHLSEKPKTVFPENLVQKPDVVELDGTIAHFSDGSSEEIDVVFFCTGYLYNFPFLDSSCGITVEDNCVEPLYRHMVNIEHPTMCFIGIPYYVCAFSMFDLQVRYYLRSLQGLFQLPNRESMYEHKEAEAASRGARGYNKRQTHMMGPDQETYYKSLADEASTKTLPSVLTKIREESSLRFLHNLQGYRTDIYKIIDDDTYEIISSNGAKEIIC